MIKLPSGVFRPYAGVSTAILLFTKTNSGGTDHVWFYDVQADGFSLDDKRNPIEANDLPDLLERWLSLTKPGEAIDTMAEPDEASELTRSRTEQSFCVPRAEVEAQGYDLSINRYKQVVHADVEHRTPAEIIDELEALEAEVARGLADLKAMLG